MKKIIATVAAFLALQAIANAQGTSISSLPAATLPLAGTEVAPIVQGGATKKAPVSAFGLTGLIGDVTATGPGLVPATLATTQSASHTWAALQTYANGVNISGNPTFHFNNPYLLGDSLSSQFINSVGASPTLPEVGQTTYFTNLAGTATITGSTLGTVLTVTNVASGTIATNMTIRDATGNLVKGTMIVAQLSGTTGGIGTYSINVSQTVVSESMIATIFKLSGFDGMIIGANGGDGGVRNGVLDMTAAAPPNLNGIVFEADINMNKARTTPDNGGSPSQPITSTFYGATGGVYPITAFFMAEGGGTTGSFSAYRGLAFSSATRILYSTIEDYSTHGTGALLFGAGVYPSDVINLTAAAGTYTAALSIANNKSISWIKSDGITEIAPIVLDSSDFLSLGAGTSGVKLPGFGSGVLYTNGVNQIQSLAGTSTTVLHGNASGIPSYGAVSLTADVSGQLPNANLLNPAATVNGQTCTLGSPCTVAAAAGTLTGATLASGVTASSLTSVGTLTSLGVTGNINSASGVYQLAGSSVLSFVGSYTKLLNGDGVAGIQLGSIAAGNGTNYYSQAAHAFTNSAQNVTYGMIGPGWQIGSAPTGGDKGSGTINIQSGIYVNGSAGLSTVCTVTVGNTLTFTNGILTTKGANCT